MVMEKLDDIDLSKYMDPKPGRDVYGYHFNLLVKKINEQREVIALLTAAIIEIWRDNSPEGLDVLINMLRHSTDIEGKESIF